MIWEPSFCFKSPIALGYTRGHFTALVPFEKSELISYMSCNNNNSEHDFNENDLERSGACNSSISFSSNANNGPINNTSNNNVNHSNSANSGFNIGTTTDPINNNPTLLGAVSSSSSSSSSSNNNFDQTSNADSHHQTFYLPLANNEGHLLPVHFLTSAELGRERTILKQYLNLDCIVMPGSNCGLLVAQQRVPKRAMLVTRMLEEWLSYYKNMQAKEYGRQIELSQETTTTTPVETINTTNESQMMGIVRGGSGVVSGVNDGNFNSMDNSNGSISLPQQTSLQDNQYEVEDEDDEDDDDDDDDDDDEEIDSGDSPDENESAEEDYDDDEYADEVEVQ